MLFYFAHKAAGASSARHSLRPPISESGMLLAELARMRGENADAYFDVIARREATKQSILVCGAMDCFACARNDDDGPFENLTQLSSSANADDPVFQCSCDRIEKPRRTGYPACAGYDGLGEDTTHLCLS